MGISFRPHPDDPGLQPGMILSIGMLFNCLHIFDSLTLLCPMLHMCAFSNFLPDSNTLFEPKACTKVLLFFKFYTTSFLCLSSFLFLSMISPTIPVS